MGRALLLLVTPELRAKAIHWIGKAPHGTRVTFQGPKRTLPQNAKAWAMLTDISEQYRHHGQRLTPDDLKDLFMDALNRESRMVPNLDNTGWVNLGRSTSNLSTEEFAGMIEIMHEWGARNGIVFTEPDAGPPTP